VARRQRWASRIGRSYSVQGQLARTAEGNTASVGRTAARASNAPRSPGQDKSHNKPSSENAADGNHGAGCRSTEDRCWRIEGPFLQRSGREQKPRRPSHEASKDVRNDGVIAYGMSLGPHTGMFPSSASNIKVICDTSCRRVSVRSAAHQPHAARGRGGGTGDPLARAPTLGYGLMDCEEDRTLRAVLIGMLREADR
jgi:hypothetical protein